MTADALIKILEAFKAGKEIVTQEGEDFDMENWLDQHGLSVKREPREVWIPEGLISNIHAFHHSKVSCHATFPSYNPVLFREVL